MGGSKRKCPACGASHYPRTDPVVIGLVTDGEDRLLLGRDANHPPEYFTCLAGFLGNLFSFLSPLLFYSQTFLSFHFFSFLFLLSFFLFFLLSVSHPASLAEPGETIEEAFAREVKEESGIEIRLDTVKVVQSQPWPFQSNLMIGCMAQAATTEIKVDKAELDDARWFTKQEVSEALRQSSTHFKLHTSSRDASSSPSPSPSLPPLPGVSLKVPPSITISHWLMAGWATGNPLSRTLL